MDNGVERVPDASTIRLVSSTASKITNVSLYSGRADVTRVFEFEVKAGENIVLIVGLPRSLQENNMRVAGLGNASIHNVVIGKAAEKHRSRSRYSVNEAPIVRSRKEIQKSLESSRRSRSSLDAYLTSITAQDIVIPRLEATLDGYTRLCEKLDKQILDLEEKLEDITNELRGARGLDSNDQATPSWEITVSLYGKIDERVKLSITYAVCSADWTPCYDVRVDTQNKEHAATITYKAIITQATGESWENVPLTLGTVTPSFGVQPPTLSPWFIDSFKPPSFITMSSVSPLNIHQAQPTIIAATPSRHARSYSDRSRSRSPPRRRELYSPSVSTGSPRPDLVRTTVDQPIVIPVSNKGDIVATFTIPGLITVPNDEGKHNVTVAELTMETTLLWYAIPAVDRMVHLKARIKNASDYIFVPGSANIYVDGSFVATTRLPSVSPQEMFDCSLGLDQSIRVTYHPLEKKSAKSGFVTKTTSRSFTQRITVLNTKSTTLKNMKIIDRIPVSADERIEVKLLNPALNIPSSGQPGVNTSMQKGGSSVYRPALVSENILAQWDGADGDPASDVSQDGVGKNGKINWVLSIPPQMSVSLVLQFDVIYPENLLVQGV